MTNFRSLKFVSLVTIGLILSKASGFLKHYIIVYFFGLSTNSDAFFVANTLSEMLVNILISGVITGALIPLLGEIKVLNNHSFYTSFIRKLFVISAIISILCSLILFFLADLIADILAPGFSAETKTIVSKLLEILSPGLFFLGLVALLNGILTMNENFFLVSIGLFLSNTTTILITILLKEKYGIYSVAIGTSLGFFIWFLSHLPATFSLIKRSAYTRVDIEYYFRLLKLAIPAIVIIFLTNVIFIIEKIFASNFEQGTITKLTFTYRVVFIVANILIIPLGTVLLPNLSKKAGSNQYSEIISLLRKSFVVISILLFAVLSINILNIDLISQLINFVFTRNFSFDSEILFFFLFYSLSYIGLFYYLILMRLSYALKRSMDLIYANSIGIIAYVFTVYIYPGSHPAILPAAYMIFMIITNIFLILKSKYSYFPGKTSLLSVNIIIKGAAILLIAVSINFWLLNTIYYSLAFSIVVLFVFFIVFKAQLLQLIKKS